MDPTLIASFNDPDSAESAFNALMDLGVQPEDLSLILNGDARGGPPPGEYDPAIVTGLDNLNLGETQAEEEGSYVHESRVGGGISTSGIDDSVASLDEMEDSQSASEEETYPEAGASFGAQESHDVMEAARSGFFNTTEPDRSTAGRLDGPDSEPTPTLEVSSMSVPGIGRVIGDGMLATLATGAMVASRAGGRNAAGIADYLVDAGVPANEASEISRPLQRGGAILAATIRPGDANGVAAEDVLSRHGAQILRTYNDLPEPNG